MADTIPPDDLLRELYELIEEADNSCSEPDDFIRGMRFLFDALAQKVAPTEPVVAEEVGSARHPLNPSGGARRLTP